MATVPNRVSASQQCYEKLRHLLLFGQIPPGDRLPEIEWCQRLGTHRAALREAMALLAHDGLLRRGDRGGFFVPLLEKRDIDEVWEARAVVEAGAIQLIGTLGLDAEALEPLARICDTMQHLLDANMLLGYMEADRKFHETLVDLSGNDRLIAMYRRSALPHFTFRSSDPHAIRHTAATTIEEHRQIHRSLVAGDIPEAVAVLGRHLHMKWAFCHSLEE